MRNIGIDWANCKHDLVLRDDSRRILKTLSVEHSAKGFLDIQAQVLQLSSRPVTSGSSWSATTGHW